MDEKRFPSTPPLYDTEITWSANAENGPRYSGPIPIRKKPESDSLFDFLGFSIASPLGVAAGPLLNSRWTTLAAELGFDIVTYKTIRSTSHPAHPLPNVVQVQCSEQLRLDALPSSVLPAEETQRQDQLAITNSFGNPSREADFLLADIDRAKTSLAEGQVLVVSVFGTEKTDRTLTQDFVTAAVLAKEAGAQIIEANYSCPNVSKGEGALYLDDASVFSLTRAISQAIGDTPLIIKLGTFANVTSLENTLTAAARGGAQAVCGINTISLKLLSKQGNPVLGPNRPTTGICGNPIRSTALEFVRDARRIIDHEQLGLTLMGVGGITHPSHFDAFLQAGANAALTATGMMWDPYLAARYHHSKQHITEAQAVTL